MPPGVHSETVRVLVAEDDEGLGEVLARGLREQGYVVDLVPDGEAAAAYLRFYQYEVAVLDWRMPSLSGFDLVQRLRRSGTTIPVLMLTARDTPADRIAGLDAGADDYLVKPFDFGQLLARLRALQRRPRQAQDRKSTRLNSSHRCISYAVFCLKKKTHVPGASFV